LEWQVGHSRLGVNRLVGGLFSLICGSASPECFVRGVEVLLW
jgi:hypothetical protein